MGYRVALHRQSPDVLCRPVVSSCRVALSLISPRLGRGRHGCRVEAQRVSQPGCSPSINDFLRGCQGGKEERIAINSARGDVSRRKRLFSMAQCRGPCLPRWPCYSLGTSASVTGESAATQPKPSFGTLCERPRVPLPLCPLMLHTSRRTKRHRQLWAASFSGASGLSTQPPFPCWRWRDWGPSMPAASLCRLPADPLLRRSPGARHVTAPQVQRAQRSHAVPPSRACD